MAKYAYIRVSTKEQNIDRQLVALEPYRIPERNIYCDYQSGKDFDRPAYKKLLGKLRQGDLLIVKSIDRLGRNYNEILVQWQNITKDIGADILVLDMVRRSIDVSCVCVNAYILWRRETAEHTTAHSFSGLMCIYNRSQYLLGRMGIWMFGDAVSGSHDIAALLRSDYCNSWPFSTSNNTRN